MRQGFFSGISQAVGQAEDRQLRKQQIEQAKMREAVNQLFRQHVQQAIQDHQKAALDEVKRQHDLNLDISKQKIEQAGQIAKDKIDAGEKKGVMTSLFGMMKPSGGGYSPQDSLAIGQRLFGNQMQLGGGIPPAPPPDMSTVPQMGVSGQAETGPQAMAPQPVPDIMTQPSPAMQAKMAQGQLASNRENRLGKSASIRDQKNLASIEHQKIADKLANDRAQMQAKNIVSEINRRTAQTMNDKERTGIAHQEANARDLANKIREQEVGISAGRLSAEQARVAIETRKLANNISQKYMSVVSNRYKMFDSSIKALEKKARDTRAIYPADNEDKARLNSLADALDKQVGAIKATPEYQQTEKAYNDLQTIARRGIAQTKPNGAPMQVSPAVVQPPPGLKVRPGKTPIPAVGAKKVGKKALISGKGWSLTPK